MTWGEGTWQHDLGRWSSSAGVGGFADVARKEIPVDGFPDGAPGDGNFMVKAERR